MAKKHKQKIRIFFRDGKQDVIPQKYWDNYEVCMRDSVSILAVIKKGQWIAVYNMKDITAFVVG